MKDIVLILLYTTVFIFIIYKLPFFRIPGIRKSVMGGLFVLKVLASIVLVIIYTHYYKDRLQSDIYKYYKDGNVIYSSLQNNSTDYLRMMTGFNANSEDLKPYYAKMGSWFKEYDYGLYNDNRTIIRCNAFFRLFSFGSIYVHNIFMAFLSFIGLTALLRIFLKYTPDKKILTIIAVYFLPSVLLWTSGNLKEGIVIFAFGMFIYLFYKILHNKRLIINLVFLVLITTLLLLSKFYVLFAALPGLIFLIFYHSSTGKKNILLKFIMIHLFLFFLIVINHLFIHVKPDVFETIAYKQHDFINLAKYTEAGSYIEIPRLEPNILSFIKASPVAIFNSLFRPTFGDINSIIIIPAFIETYLIIIFILLSLVFIKTDNIRKHKDIFYFSISFSLIMLLLTGLTTPVIGALVRYKVPALPFLVFTAVLIINMDKIKHLSRLADTQKNDYMATTGRTIKSSKK